MRHPLPGVLTALCALAIGCDSPGSQPGPGADTGSDAGDHDLVQLDGDGGSYDPDLGRLAVSWTLGTGPTCESFSLAQLSVRLEPSEAEATVRTAPCPGDQNTGTVNVYNITPGTYAVTLEALDADGAARFTGKLAEPLAIERGVLTETEPIWLTAKPATLIVSWTPPAGDCAASDLALVDLRLLDRDWQSLGYDAQLSCETTFEDPADGTTRDGVLFDDLDPVDGMIVEVTGINLLGEAIARGRKVAIFLGVGEREEALIDLEPCSPLPCE